MDYYNPDDLNFFQKLGNMVRHNLTVTLDGNPVTDEEKTYLPGFFAENEREKR